VNVERLKQLGIEQKDIADRLGLSGGGVSLKVNGHRPWKREEIDAVLELARQKDPEITYEQLFAGAAACA
jgi:transcriptional regulator with XRE-family HTH domain